MGERTPVRIFLRTQLNPGAESTYEQLHQAVPDSLLVALSDAGITEWVIVRDGTGLLHLIEADDPQRSLQILADHAAHAAWLEQVEPLLAQTAAAQIAPLWSLSDQLAAPEPPRKAT
jgi:L-rhamnose mutarotase